MEYLGLATISLAVIVLILLAIARLISGDSSQDLPTQIKQCETEIEILRDTLFGDE